VILDLFTLLATLATGTSTKPTVASTAMASTTVKSATTKIATSKATTPAPATTAAGRRKRDVDNGKPVETDGTLYIIPIYSIFY